MDSISDLTTIIEEYQTPLLRYAGSFFKNKEDAKDAVQEVFIRFIKTIQKKDVKNIDNPGAWLYRCTRNFCLDQLKSKRAKTEITIQEDIGTFADKSHSADQKIIEKEEMQILKEVINKLEPRDKEILVLKIEQEKSYKEIAQIMDLSVSNVGFILHNSIKKMQKLMKMHFVGKYQGGQDGL